MPAPHALPSYAPPDAPIPRPPPRSSDNGVQGRFHLLLHLRVRQRGSPRQARGPGARRAAIDRRDTFVRSLAHSWQAGRAGGARLLRGWDDSLSSSSSSSSPPSASSSSHIDTHLPSPTNTPSTHPSIMIRSPMASSTRASRRTPTPRWLARRRRKPAW
eukprot:30993-Pelagococcus_subviridis.AAC.13